MAEQFEPAVDRTPIQSFQFSSASLDAKEKFDGWREFMAPLSDIERLAPASGGYHGRALIYDLGPFQLASFDMDPAAFNYTKKHMQQSGMEHWSLNLINKGSIGYASGNGLKAEAGEMYSHSYASPFSGAA